MSETVLTRTRCEPAAIFTFQLRRTTVMCNKMGVTLQPALSPLPCDVDNVDCEDRATGGCGPAPPGEGVLRMVLIVRTWST